MPTPDQMRGPVDGDRFTASMRDHLDVTAFDETGHQAVRARIDPVRAHTITPEDLRRLAGTLLELADTIDT